jgi:hypothetical protein
MKSPFESVIFIPYSISTYFSASRFLQLFKAVDIGVLCEVGNKIGVLLNRLFVALE